MYDLARGPLLWVTFIIFACGIVYRTVQLFLATRKKDPVYFGTARPLKKAAVDSSPEDFKNRLVVSFQNTLLGKHPVMAIVTTVFHLCLFIVPVFLLAHNLELYKSLGFSFITLPDPVCDFLTIICILCTGFFLIRRLLVPRVKAVSSFYDYIVLIITAAPFLTGFFAYHQWFDYTTILTIHILAGEIMLLSIPLTKLGHMIFFFFARMLLGGEYGFSSGSRTWAT